MAGSSWRIFFFLVLPVVVAFLVMNAASGGVAWVLLFLSFGPVRYRKGVGGGWGNIYI